MGAGSSTVQSTLRDSSGTDLKAALDQWPGSARGKLKAALASFGDTKEAPATGDTNIDVSTPRKDTKQEPKPAPTLQEVGAIVDTVIEMTYKLDRDMNENAQDVNAPGELGRMAAQRTPRLRRKSKDLAEEFQKAMGPNLEAVFALMDTDNSGNLDRGELKAAFAAAGRPADDETIDNAVKALDTDGDVRHSPLCSSLLPSRRRTHCALPPTF